MPFDMSPFLDIIIVTVQTRLSGLLVVVLCINVVDSATLCNFVSAV